MVEKTWKRGHSVRGRGDRWPREVTGPELLPAPDDDDFDLGDIELPGEPATPVSPPAPPQTGEDTGPGDIPSAAPPSWLGDAGKPKRGRPAGGRGKPPRVTADMRRDIEAKFGLMLQIPGRIWYTRDPYCGGAWLEQEPAIRAAGLELIMQSPDLIAFFTSTAGGFMLWLNLLAALQPVALAVWAHHIVHAVEAEGQEQDQAAGERQYAA